MKVNDRHHHDLKLIPTSTPGRRATYVCVHVTIFASPERRCLHKRLAEATAGRQWRRAEDFTLSTHALVSPSVTRSNKHGPEWPETYTTIAYTLGLSAMIWYEFYGFTFFKFSSSPPRAGVFDPKISHETPDSNYPLGQWVGEARTTRNRYVLQWRTANVSAQQSNTHGTHHEMLQAAGSPLERQERKEAAREVPGCAASGLPTAGGPQQ